MRFVALLRLLGPSQPAEAALGITPSMKELCDNASIEFFFHSMKADTIHARTFDDDYLRGTLAHPSTTKNISA